MAKITERRTVNIELDLADPDDKRLLELISTYKARIAQGEHPTLFSPSPDSQFPRTRPMAQVGGEINRAANNLASQIGSEPRKMSTKERASLAAKTRWDKIRAEKQNSTAPHTPAVRKKKSTQPEPDLSKAEEVPIGTFPSQNAQDLILQSFEQPNYPDGREILDGTYHRRLTSVHGQQIEPLGDEDDETDDSDPLSDEDIDEIRERARKYEANK